MKISGRKDGPASSQKKKSPLDNFPIQIPQREHIGPAERRGPHNLKDLTEVTGGGVLTAHNLEDLPRIVRTIGQAVRYRYVLTYKPLPKTDGRVVPNGIRFISNYINMQVRITSLDTIESNRPLKPHG